jgi:hypothetical protein
LLAARLLSVGLHLPMIGRPGRIGALRRILEHMTSCDGVLEYIPPVNRQALARRLRSGLG